MNLASSLFVGLVLTDFTGIIFFLVELLLWRFVKKDAVFLRFLTTITIGACLVPYVYIVLYLYNRATINVDGTSYSIFYITPLILPISAALGCIWIGLFLALLAYRLYRRYRWARLCRGNIPEEDERISRIFIEVCGKLGIEEGKVSLFRNDSIQVPCITYYHGYVVMLPLRGYSEQEARIVFYHELCHYLNRDLYLKTAGCIAALLHVFNPLIHILFKRLDLLCEWCCDRAACDRGAGTFTEKEYFEVILHALVSDTKTDRYQLFALADDKTNFERRVEYMLGYHKQGGLKKGTALALAACFLAGSSMTAFAAGDSMTGAYEGLAEVSSAWDVEDLGVSSEIKGTVDNVNQEALPIVDTCEIDPARVTVMDDGIEPMTKVKAINWTIPAGDTFVSLDFWQSEGDVIDLVVMGDPEDVVYRAGIQDTGAVFHCIEGTGRMNGQYIAGKTGFYAFFVANMSETEEIKIQAYVFRD